MKCRITTKRSENGIALVITLVMLAIVTVMTIVFLAVTRRERSSVKVTEETAVAKDMADSALERAKTEATAGMNASGSKLHYDLFNSQTFYNPNGFDPNRPLTNVNVAPVRDWPAIRQNSEQNYLEMLANLQYDPAVPVFIQTNQNGSGELRHYLDFNRNRQFETNGFLYDLDINERPIVERINNQNFTNVYRFVGDPEWVGVLERPDYPHSETNRFVGRMAYLALPAGKSLDLNFIHNQVNPDERLDQASARIGYSRSQGVGSWEINLAAFLRELNTNTYAWRRDPLGYRFTIVPNQPPTGAGYAYEDARALLKFRYTRRSHLKSIFETLGRDNMLNPINNSAVFARFGNNNVDDFGDRPYLASSGEIFFPPNQAPIDQDDATLPGWPGSVNTNAFTDLQQLFSVQSSSAAFTNRLQLAARRGAAPNSGRSSYDRYGFYRLAAQLGTDSEPALEGKIHLNYRNPVGLITNTVTPWTNAVEFFTNAVNLMLKASIDGTVVISNRLQELTYGRQRGTYYVIGDTLVRTNFSITNIQVEAINPVALPYIHQNEYTPTIHRILQVAANIYDNMSDKGPAFPHYPTVFVPLFSKTASNLVISGFAEATDDRHLLRQWRDFSDVLTNNTYVVGPHTNLNFYGQHFVIGAKKGHPNFNELALQSTVDISRKLSATRQSTGTTNIVSTNQMFLVSMQNRWGIEAWNSYTNDYNRRIKIAGQVISQVVLRDGTNLLDLPVWDQTVTTFVTTNTPTPWSGADQFLATNLFVLFDRQIPIMRDLSYSTNRGAGMARFGATNALASFGPLERTPEFILYTTNKVRFWMIDDSTERIIDFVSFDRLVTVMDLRKHLFVPPTQSGAAFGSQNNVSENMFWDPTPIGGIGSAFTVGHSNQLAMAAGEFNTPPQVSDSLWRSYRFNSPDKRGAISVWRQFLGLPLRAEDDPDAKTPPELVHQVPFTPTRQIRWTISWQANDPLVHYMHQDLRRVELDQALSVLTTPAPDWDIGKRNKAYHPWGGNTDQQSGQQDEFSYNVGLQDPGIRMSDDWEFPVMRKSTFNGNTNYFYPNIGTLGQVHRGTPWQTIYLKSIYRRNPNDVDPIDGRARRELFVDPSVWARWSGSIGTYPSGDWRLLDVFTTAANESAASGLLAVNQTNTAAWSAVLGGTVVARTAVRTADIRNISPFKGVRADEGFEATVAEPGSLEVATIVQSIIDARTNQFDIIRHPNARANPKTPYVALVKTNQFLGQPVAVFNHMGDVLGAPALSVQNPYLLRDLEQVQKVWTDKAVEYIPQQILSLLKKDEPRFVVYSFGQSLKPAPRSLTSDPNFYHMCTNYQITGEVITKTTFRVEGQPRSQQNPLRTVVEKYEILPPSE